MGSALISLPALIRGRYSFKQLFNNAIDETNQAIANGTFKERNSSQTVTTTTISRDIKDNRVAAQAKNTSNSSSKLSTSPVTEITLRSLTNLDLELSKAQESKQVIPQPSVNAKDIISSATITLLPAPKVEATKGKMNTSSLTQEVLSTQRTVSARKVP